jgi:plasmid stabilization system protein ParE
MFRVLVEAEAGLEWNSAVDWYEEHEPGVGLRFNAEVHALLKVLSRDPERFPLVSRLTRKARIPGWPYSVFFAIEATHREIKVIAIWHGARDPKTLERRLR